MPTISKIELNYNNNKKPHSSVKDLHKYPACLPSKPQGQILPPLFALGSTLENSPVEQSTLWGQLNSKVLLKLRLLKRVICVVSVSVRCECSVQSTYLYDTDVKQLINFRNKLPMIWFNNSHSQEMTAFETTQDRRKIIQNPVLSIAENFGIFFFPIPQGVSMCGNFSMHGGYSQYFHLLPKQQITL